MLANLNTTIVSKDSERTCKLLKSARKLFAFFQKFLSSLKSSIYSARIIEEAATIRTDVVGLKTQNV